MSLYLLIPFFYVINCRDRFDVVVDAENGIPLFSPLYSLKPKVCLMFHVHRRVFLRQMPFPLSHLFVWLETVVMPRIYRNVSFVAISDDTRKEMESFKISNGPISVVKSGLSERYRREGRKSEYPSICYCGRLQDYKRIDRVIVSFAEVHARYPDSRLTIVGAGPDRERLEQMSSALGLAGSVRFTGFISEESKIKILQESWIFISASLMEGWGLAAAEALACGTPAVVHDVPGLREVVENGRTGYVVPDNMSLGPAMIRLIEDARLLESFCEAATETAKRHSWSAASEEMLDVLSTVSAAYQNLVLSLGGEWSLLTSGGGLTLAPMEVRRHP